MNLLHLVVPLLSVVGVAALLGVASYFFPPTWLDELLPKLFKKSSRSVSESASRNSSRNPSRKSSRNSSENVSEDFSIGEGSRRVWCRLNAVCGAVAAILGVLAVLLWHSLPLLPLVAVGASVASMGFVLAMSLRTDVLLRLVDRRMLMLATVPPAVLHGAVATGSAGDRSQLAAWLIVCLVSGSLIFIPGLMGASDGRALLLVAVASFPILGPRMFSAGFVGFLVLAILYSFVATLHDVRQHGDDAGDGAVGDTVVPEEPFAPEGSAVAVSTQRQRTSFGRFLKIFLTKRSLPAVPLIVAPFVTLTLVASLLQF